jgi:4-diphosphocytidyl-2C-methyl-D-erythritol kinase
VALMSGSGATVFLLHDGAGDERALRVGGSPGERTVATRTADRVAPVAFG